MNDPTQQNSTEFPKRLSILEWLAAVLLMAGPAIALSAISPTAGVLCFSICACLSHFLFVHHDKLDYTHERYTDAARGSVRWAFALPLLTTLIFITLTIFLGVSLKGRPASPDPDATSAWQTLASLIGTVSIVGASILHVDRPGLTRNWHETGPHRLLWGSVWLGLFFSISLAAQIASADPKPAMGTTILLWLGIHGATSEIYKTWLIRRRNTRYGVPQSGLRPEDVFIPKSEFPPFNPSVMTWRSRTIAFFSIVVIPTFIAQFITPLAVVIQIIAFHCLHASLLKRLEGGYLFAGSALSFVRLALVIVLCYLLIAFTYRATESLDDLEHGQINAFAARHTIPLVGLYLAFIFRTYAPGIGLVRRKGRGHSMTWPVYLFLVYTSLISILAFSPNTKTGYDLFSFVFVYVFLLFLFANVLSFVSLARQHVPTTSHK